MSLNRVVIPSPNYSSRSGSSVRLIVIHTAEGATTIQSLGAFFANPSSQVSSHTGVDDTPNTVGEYVQRSMKAWTAANANPVAIQTELCAFASWTSAQWNQHPTMLQNCAKWIAEEAAYFNIPIVRLTPAQAQSNGRGVCGHVDLGNWGGNHWDPGPNFPMDQVIAMAQGNTPPTPTPPPTEDDTMAITPVIQPWANQLSIAQVSLNSLWHKWSTDGGKTWNNEVLIGPSGAPVKASLKNVVSISTEENTMFITTEDDSNKAWVSRQSRGGQWDTRATP